MRKSRTKRKTKSFLFGVILLVFLLFIVGINITLGYLKDTFTSLAAAYFTQRLHIDNVLYLPPNYIFLKDVSFTETAATPEKQIFSVPIILAKFSTLQFVKRGKIVITDICAYNTATDYAPFRDFVRDNYKQIVAFIMDLPRQDVRFMVKDMRLHLGSENGGPGYINSKLFLKIKDNALFGYGSFSRNLDNQAPGLPLDYIFKGALAPDGVTLENVEVMRENLYAKLWGSVHNRRVRVNGFSFVNTKFAEHAYYEPFLTFKERLENFLRGFPAPPRMPEMSKIDLFILDIESQINFALPRIEIDTLKLSVNNNPISLKGTILFSWKDPILLDLALATSFTRLKQRADENLNFKKLEVALKGSYKDKVFTGDAKVNFDFLNKVKSTTPLEAFDAGLSGVTLSFSRFPRITLSMRNADIYCRTDSNEYTMQLPHFSAWADLKDPTVKFCQFFSGFYDGSIAGRLWLDLAPSSPQLTAMVRLKHATANKMQGLMEHFAKIHGKISGQMQFKTFPDFKLKGGLTVHNGYIEKFEFLKWLAQSFVLPSLNKLGFFRADANFSVDPEGAGLRDISLNSSELSLGGAFHLGANDMVNSKISMTFTRDLMERSPKFKALLRLVGKDVSVLTFDFRLSGNLHHMNFQWLESDFKKKLHDAIPGFMERSVERQIEESLAPLSSAN